MTKRVKPRAGIADLRDRAFRAGVRISELLAMTHISGATWARWVKGMPYTISKLEDMNRALDALIAKEDLNGETPDSHHHP